MSRSLRRDGEKCIVLPPFLRRVSLMVASSLLAVTAGSAAAGGRAEPAGACLTVEAGAGVAVDLPTLSVTVTGGNAAYRRGQTAILPVRVRVAAPGGPAVAGASLSVTVSQYGQPLKTVGSMTGKDGTVRVPIRIPSTAKPGKISALVEARSILVPGSDCSPGLVYQVGSGLADPFGTVTE